jgi:hypothetical protein
MTISKEIVKAVLRKAQLKKIFLEKIKISEEDLDIQVLLKDEKLSEKLVHTMLEVYLDYNLEYPHPINTSAQVMNPIKVMGVRGVYMVLEDYQEINSKFSFFSSKAKAKSYANLAYEEFLIKTNLKSRSKGLKPYLN